MLAGSYSHAVRQLATVDGTAFWVFGASYGGYGAWYFLANSAGTAGTQISGASASWPGYYDGRCIGIFAGQLYGTDSSTGTSTWATVFKFGTNLPTTEAATEATALTGIPAVSTT